MCIRLLCSLPSLLICIVIYQITIHPSFTVNLHCCKSGCSAPFLQQWGHSQLTLLTAYFNLFQFFPIYLNFYWIYLNLFEFYGIFQESVWRKLLGQFWVSCHHPTFGLAYIVDKVFIQAFGLACEVYVEVSLLCSLPTTVCEVADSVVCQVAMLPSFNSLWG